MNPLEVEGPLPFCWWCCEACNKKHQSNLIHTSKMFYASNLNSFKFSSNITCTWIQSPRHLNVCLQYYLFPLDAMHEDPYCAGCAFDLRYIRGWRLGWGMILKNRDDIILTCCDGALEVMSLTWWASSATPRWFCHKMEPLFFSTPPFDGVIVVGSVLRALFSSYLTLL